MKNYTSYIKNIRGNTIASGGVAIIVKNDIQSSEILLNTNLEAVAITTHVPNMSKITICNLYLPPNCTFNQGELVQLNIFLIYT